MEEHTDTVDYVIDNTEKDLLMRVEEQISTQVAKTESDEDSGDEDDPVMVTCGKLIISAPDKDERKGNWDEIQIPGQSLQSIKNEENKHFTLKSIEKVDEEDFEAIFEINSDMDEIGLSESDIKALEFMESKEYIVLPDNTERPAQDDFSTSVLKFQDAIENYTKSVFSGITDTMDGIGEAKTAKSQPSAEKFSETVDEVENKYAGRIPVVEEQFEEIIAYVCGDSEVHLSQPVEEPFEEIQVSHFEDTPTINDIDKYEYQQTNANEFEDDHSLVEEPIKDSQNTMVPEDEDLNDKKIHETESDHIEEELQVPNYNSITKLNVSSEHIDQSESIIKTSEIPNLLELDNTTEDTKTIDQQINVSTPFLEEDSEIKNTDINDKVEINHTFDIIGEPVIITLSGIEEGESDETTDIKQHIDETFLEKLSNEASSKMEKDAKIENELDEEKNKEKLLNDVNCDVVKVKNVVEDSVGGQSEKSEEAEMIVKSVDETNFKYDLSKVTGIEQSSIPMNDVEKNETNEKIGVCQPISPSKDAEVNKYENVSAKGLQRNAESRKSKRKIRNQKPFSQDEESKNDKSSTRNMEEMQLLLNTILVIALGIFLFLISGDASSYTQDSSSESITRIPATVSTVIDGYVQLSSLSEVELRK